MKNKQPKKILVALDGSDWSSKTVTYLMRFKPGETIKIDLFHVFSGIPECYRDLETAPSGRPWVSQAKAWEMVYRRDITDFIERSRSLLISSGFPEGNVSIDIQECRRGIARDIIDKAKNGYTALVAGKKGFGELPETALGSVARKLVETVEFIPLMLTDLRPPTGTVLIAVDGSPGSDRAVACAAELMGESSYRFVLVSVLRGYNADQGLPGRGSQDQSTSCLLDEAASSLVLDDARDVLQAAGVAGTAIVQELILGAQSRTKALVSMAEKHRCDTVILGRKGWSDVEEFSLGRVAEKSIYMAKETTVWIVSLSDTYTDTRR